MRVTLKGMPDGKDFEYETGTHNFINPIKFKISEQKPSNTRENSGEKLFNERPTKYEITFLFLEEIDGRCIYILKNPNV